MNCSVLEFEHHSNKYLLEIMFPIVGWCGKKKEIYRPLLNPNKCDHQFHMDWIIYESLFHIFFLALQKTTKKSVVVAMISPWLSSHRYLQPLRIRCSVAPSRWPTAQRRWWRNAKPAMSSAGTPGGLFACGLGGRVAPWVWWKNRAMGLRISETRMEFEQKWEKRGRTWWFWHVLTLDLGSCVFHMFTQSHVGWLLGASRSRL